MNQNMLFPSLFLFSVLLVMRNRVRAMRSECLRSGWLIEPGSVQHCSIVHIDAVVLFVVGKVDRS